MRTTPHVINGWDTVRIHYVETEEGLDAFRDWLHQPRRAMAVDTETEGLAWEDRVRLVQFGDCADAWVLRADRLRHDIRGVLALDVPLVFHNATFDLLKLEREGYIVSAEAVWPRVLDTKTLAHLIDPRQESEGGIGTSLKPLSAHYIDPDAPDTQNGLTKVFNALGFTKETGWRLIPIDHPTYVLYAGLDVIFTARLLEVLGPLVKERGLDTLASFEREVSRVLAAMERRGLLLDVPYTEGLVGRLADEEALWVAKAADLGVDNINSGDQVAAAMLAMGEDLTEKTPSGKWQMDKPILLALADLDREWERIGAREPNPLAEAVLKGKQAAGFGTKYAAKFLTERDVNGRVHASIKALEARTARMSISQPPLQQLPSGDWTVRRCFVADPGMAIFSADYSQVEMRILAALAQDRRLLEVIRSGEDIHSTVAKLLFGEGFSKLQRKLAKNVGFGKVYGGGAETLARQSGTSIEVAQSARRMFDRTFPGVKRYTRGLQDRADHGRREVVTPSGRHLPLDRDRLYAAGNYVIQSTARDVLAQALLDLDAAGLGDYLLLPVHDEVLGQAPVAEVQDVANEVARVMSMDFRGVFLEAEPDVYGASWGHGYGATV